jgi:hypothetical protein
MCTHMCTHTVRMEMRICIRGHASRYERTSMHLVPEEMFVDENVPATAHLLFIVSEVMCQEVVYTTPLRSTHVVRFTSLR